VTNNAHQAVWRWDQQEPFGVNVADENPSALGQFEFLLRFPGQYADEETNLFYNHFRDYDPNLGIYKESDLIGLQGGLNTYSYVSAAPLRSIDPTGLLEDFTLTLNQQPLTTLACDCGDNFTVFSGIGAARNDPSQIANSDIGPIPAGKYYIVARQSGGLLGRLRDWGRRAQGNDPTSWFSLIAMDGDNDDCTVVNGVVRCAFRMHPGRVSQGCITFPSSTDFHRLRDRLLNTTIDLIPGTKIPYYGTVTVQ
jgi:RHS repeat-associated protein